MKILIVEDDGDTREVLSLLLTKAGHEVIEAADGESAIKEFTNCDCSVVLLDWMLPGMSGLEVADRLRAIRHVYIIMVTGKEKEVNAINAIEAGVRDYLQKPFDPVELMESVEVAELIVTARELLRKRFDRLGVGSEIVNRYFMRS